MAFTFGQNQPTLNFGSTQNKPGFGTSATPSFGTSTFGSANTSTFGANPTPAFGSGTSSGFSFGSTSSAPSLFSQNTSLLGSTPSFGANTTGGFGSNFGTTFGATNQPTSTSQSTFGAPFGTTGSSGFGGFQGFGANTSTTTSTAPLLFGGNTFGAQKPTLGTGFSFGQTSGTSGGLFGSNTTGGLFGSNTTSGGLFGPNLNTGIQSQQQLDPTQLIVNSVMNVKMFNDERDQILGKFNLLQASWGTGKGYFHPQQPPVEYIPENPYCRFKAIAYNAFDKHENKDGIVALMFSKKDTKTLQSQLQATLAQVLKPEQFQSHIEQIIVISDEKTQVLLRIVERSVNQQAGNQIQHHTIPANELAAFLNQPMNKQQLTNLGVVSIVPCVKPDMEAIQEYLKVPPSGIDPRLWKQAIEDNPDSTNQVPVPVIGFTQLKSRLLRQESETHRHQSYLNKISEDIDQLKQKYSTSATQINELKKKYMDLSHRLLKVLVKQESTRKVGMALLPEEEQLRIQLENMQAQLSIPTQFRSRLTELLANVRIEQQGNGNNGTSTGDRYRLDPEIQEEIKQFLNLEQCGINHLIEIITTDTKDLSMIKQGIQHLISQNQ